MGVFGCCAGISDMKHRWGIYTYAGRDGKITSSSELKPGEFSTNI